MMNKTRIFVGLLMALLFSMCTSPKQQGEGLPVFNVADALDAALPDTFTWNSIAKNVRMIPLKTEGLIGRGPNVKYFSDDLIIVTEYHSGVFVFDGEGQEIVSFDHRGMGPKEYLYTTRVNYNKQTKEVHKLFLTYPEEGLDFLQGASFVPRTREGSDFFEEASFVPRTILDDKYLVSWEQSDNDENPVLVLVEP